MGVTAAQGEHPCTLETGKTGGLVLGVFHQSEGEGVSLLAEGPLMARGWRWRPAGPMPTQAQEQVCSGQDAEGGALHTC